MQWLNPASASCQIEVLRTIAEDFPCPLRTLLSTFQPCLHGPLCLSAGHSKPRLGETTPTDSEDFAAAVSEGWPVSSDPHDPKSRGSVGSLRSSLRPSARFADHPHTTSRPCFRRATAHKRCRALLRCRPLRGAERVRLGARAHGVPLRRRDRLRGGASRWVDKPTSRTWISVTKPSKSFTERRRRSNDHAPTELALPRPTRMRPADLSFGDRYRQCRLLAVGPPGRRLFDCARNFYHPSQDRVGLLGGIVRRCFASSPTQLAARSAEDAA